MLTPDKNANEIFATNIKRLLQERNMSYKEFAEKLGYRASTISMWMRGTNAPRMDALEKIADFFGITISELLNDEREDKQNNNVYYLNDDARELAQFMFENPEYKILFDASRKVKKEDIEFVKQMIDRIKLTDD